MINDRGRGAKEQRVLRASLVSAATSAVVAHMGTLILLFSGDFWGISPIAPIYLHPPAPIYLCLSAALLQQWAFGRGVLAHPKCVSPPSWDWAKAASSYCSLAANPALFHVNLCVSVSRPCCDSRLHPTQRCVIREAVVLAGVGTVSDQVNRSQQRKAIK